jgi:hemerythrin-like metal-binding protein
MDWTTEYSLGVKEVDEEHETMFRYISNIEAAIDHRVEWPLIQHAIVALHRYTSIHFHSEEAMMRAHRYPKAEIHARAHSYFIKKLEEIEHHTINELEGREQMLKYLRDWFTDHLFGFDQEYTLFARGFGR